MFYIDKPYFVFFSILFVVVTIILYAWDKWTIAFKSLFILAILLLFFSIFPYNNQNGYNLIGPQVILGGFSNTTLITVIALLILGQGVVQTKALDSFINKIIDLFPESPNSIFFLSLIFVLLLSAILNNTPVVIIFIPLMQAVSQKMGAPVSRYMMPLSFVAILGGMTTLIGSSTNLLVSNSLELLSDIKIGFFDFFIPGILIASSGLLYIIFFSKYLLKNRSPMTNELVQGSDKQFIAQLSLQYDSPLIGKKSIDGKFEGLEDVSVLIVQRREHAENAPFNNMELKQGDVLVIATSREVLSEIISKKIGICGSEYSYIRNNEDINDAESNQIILESIISPSSGLIGQTIENVSFRYRFNCVVLGLQRKSRTIRRSMTEVPLEQGDVLLLQGSRSSIKKLRSENDIIPMEWATSEIVKKDTADRSLWIFFGVISISALEILPLIVSTLIGVFIMIFVKVINLRQAFRSIDYNLLFLIVTSLALGNIIQITGTANILSENLVTILKDSSSIVILSSFYLFVSLSTNFISNNACAVLFTPIAIQFAEKVNIDPKIFAISVIFAVNTSFLTPMAYQTNLLVMGPGHYKFQDFVRFGLPLTIVCWLAFIIIFPWYYKI